MQLEGILLNEMSDREIKILYDLTYLWTLKKQQASDYNKKQTHV